MKWGWLVAGVLLLLNGFFLFAVFNQNQNDQPTEQSASVQSTNKPQIVETNPTKSATSSANNQVEQKDQFSFRKTYWGMSVDEVKNTEESQPVYEQDNIVMYNSSLSGFDVSCGYLFTNGQLFRGVYTFNLQHTNDNDYIGDFDGIKATMIKKYGKPKQDEVNWKDDLYKSDPKKYGFAVSLGDLVYFTTWETKDTDIVLELTGDNYNINLRMSYWSKEIEGTHSTDGF